MIVKTISHRSAKRSATQKLIRYVVDPEKMKDEYGNREPLMVKQFVRGYDPEKWADAFKENDDKRTFTHTRRTVLRHEIISFSPRSNGFLDREKLRAFAKFYLTHRSPNSLGVCAVHYGEAIHIHFIISGVTIEGSSTRVSRKEFREFKIQLQEFQKQKYPELSHSLVEHSKAPSLKLKLSQKEQYMIQKRGVVFEKAQFSKTVSQSASKCQSLGELADKLQHSGLKPYYRNGKLIGIWVSEKRKLRLTTLGIGKTHLKQMTKEQERLDKIINLRGKRANDRELKR